MNIKPCFLGKIRKSISKSRLLNVLPSTLSVKTTVYGHRASVDREGPDQPAHPRSLIRAITVRLEGIIREQRPG